MSQHRGLDGGVADSPINGAAALLVGELRRLVVAQGREIKSLKARFSAFEKSNKKKAKRGSNGGNSSCGADIFVDAMEEFFVEFRQRLRNKGDGETRLAEETAERRACRPVGGERGGKRDFFGPGGGGEAENEPLFEEEEEAAKKESFWSDSDDSTNGSHENDSSELEDAKATLLRCISILNDKDASMNSRAQMASTLSDVVVHANMISRTEMASTLRDLVAQKECGSEVLDIAPMEGSSKRTLRLETDRTKPARVAIEQPRKKKRKATTVAELPSGYIKEENQNATKGAPKGIITPKRRPTRADSSYAEKGLTAANIKRAKKSDRICDSLDDLRGHFSVIEAKNYSGECEVCGRRTKWRCQKCKKWMCTLDNKSWNGAKCAMVFHNISFFGLAKSDFLAVHGKPVKNWQPPGPCQISLNARRVRGLLETIPKEDEGGGR